MEAESEPIQRKIQKLKEVQLAVIPQNYFSERKEFHQDVI